METSNNEIAKTEAYLLGELKTDEALLFEARTLIDPVLKMNVFFQKRIHSLVQLYGRKKLRTEIKSIEHQLFHNPQKADFKKHIHSIFNIS
jgi:hypothetical protein